MKYKYLIFLIVCLVSSCKKDDEASGFYPNVVTEFAIIQTDNAGTMTQLTTDDNRTYTISNPQKGYKKNVKYRAVCGYIPDGQTAYLYNATEAHVLRDSTELAYEPDPIKVTSVWQSGRYINMHLSPLTQGGRQYWGYRCDGVSGNTTHITLHHRQNGDPLSYTTTVYASIPIDDFETVPAVDIITLHIKTFDGEQVWTFQKP
ncbi:MAG: NigD-like N-terminal domain-containing protein [Bacteroidaceae bacterium]|nr:NigD-like N-terminal domain-containing protein [Bacteroidaceae bacterium]